MINPKRYAVYYRDIPMILQSIVSQDGAMSMVKDGVHKIDGHSCPRLTIIVNPVANKDVERIRRIEELLDELVTNNQLVGWT